MVTKFSRMGRLLHFLFHGAPLARFARKSSAKSPERQRNKYDLKTQLLTYCSLLSALKSLWRRLSNLSDCTNNGKEYESFLTKLLDLHIMLLLQRKPLLLPIASTEWMEACGLPQNGVNWTAACQLGSKITRSTKLREFQFKLLNRTLPTNDFWTKTDE